LEILRDFGSQPVSSRFTEKPLEGEFSMEMKIGVCPRTGLLQLAHTFPPEELLPRVPWLTVFEPEGHLDSLADTLASLPELSPADCIAGYSSKDDTLLRRLAARGFARQWRLDPARDLGISNPCAFVETIQIPFVAGAASRAAADLGKPKLFIVRHVLEHSYDLPGFLRAARELVAPGGYVVFEVPDCTRALENLDYTTLWEEHSVYFTPATFRKTLELSGLDPVHFEIHEHPFENCMVAVCRVGENLDTKVDESPLQLELERARRFGREFPRRTAHIQSRLKESQAQSARMALFGAGHLAVAFTCLHKTAAFFEFIVDDNPHKSGRHLAGSGLPILPSGALIEKHIDLCLLALNPEHEEKVISRNQAFLDAGGRFASIFPSSKGYLFS
jgi:hypothetical protein